MTLRPKVRLPWKPVALAACLAMAAVLVAAPTGWGLPSGMDKDVQIYPADFEKVGCTSSGCHGGGKFAPAGGNTSVTWSILDAAGTALTGNAYAKGGVYTIQVVLHNEQAPDQAHHAGFNLRVTAGKLSVPAGSSAVQVSKDQSQATHTNADHTNWTVQWTAPDSGAVVFDLFVNDVNGVNGADPGDHVYREGWWLTDSSGAQLGAAAAAAPPPEFGISLQQYWIGLIGLAGMIFIMVAGFVYLKFGNPHNTDEKDR